MTIQEIRQLHEKELLEELTKSYRGLMRAKMDLINGSSKEIHNVKNLKRHIARLKTIQRERANTIPAKAEEAKTTVIAKPTVAAKAEVTKKVTKKATKTTKKSN